MTVCLHTHSLSGTGAPFWGELATSQPNLPKTISGCVCLLFGAALLFPSLQTLRTQLAVYDMYYSLQPTVVINSAY